MVEMKGTIEMRSTDCLLLMLCRIEGYDRSRGDWGSWIMTKYFK